MPVVHLKKDVKPEGYIASLWPLNYFLGAWKAYHEERQMAREIASNYPGNSIFGSHDYDPHVTDLVINNRPAASLEAHHDRKEVHVYTDHPEAPKVIDEVIRRGFRILD